MPPYSLGNRDAQQAQSGHLRQEVGIEAVLPIQVVDPGGHLARAPLAHAQLERAVFVAKVEVHGSTRVTVTAAPRPRPSVSAALALLAATSRCSVLPKRLQTSPAAISE